MRKIKLVTLIFVILIVSVFAAGCSSATTNESQTPSESPAPTESPSIDDSQPPSESPASDESQVPSETPATADYIDGTYEGSSDAGISPGLKVSVIVKEGNIIEVDILEHDETQGIGTKAIEEIPALIIEAQSTEVDAVAGASMTSEAIKEAVNNALSE